MESIPVIYNSWITKSVFHRKRALKIAPKKDFPQYQYYDNRYCKKIGHEAPKNGHNFLEPAPYTVMLVMLKKVIFYRNFWLRDLRSSLTYEEEIKVSHLKLRVDGLYPTI